MISPSLWDATGQTALESARVLVVNASTTSTSMLKNLVLAGIGHFTILDPTTVSVEDTGNNFFLESDNSVGKLKGAETCRLLLELNDSVCGFADVSVSVTHKSVERCLFTMLYIAHRDCTCRF